MVLPDVNDYKEMDCTGASALSRGIRTDMKLKVSKDPEAAPDWLEKRNQLTGKSRPKDPEDPTQTRVDAV